MIVDDKSRLENMKSTGDPAIDALYTVRKGTVGFVDVPELGFLVVDGAGDPEGEAFRDATQALYAVSYGAHFALKKATGGAPRVMGLEALWWVEGAGAQATMERIALGESSMSESDRGLWRWRAMIMQLAPIDAAVLERAVVEAKNDGARAASHDSASADPARLTSAESRCGSLSPRTPPESQ
jgi:hypothetical protein